MGGIDPKTAQQNAAAKEAQQQKDQKKPTGLVKDGINFTKSRPTFKKSEHVGNKQEFPELGGDFKTTTTTAPQKQ